MNDIFCECEQCAALPKKPEWMSSPEELTYTAERVVAVNPHCAKAYCMHGCARREIDDYVGAARSFTRSGLIYTREGDEAKSAWSMNAAKLATAAAAAVREELLAAEAKRMAPIIAAREAAADAAMKELLAEEEREKDAPAKARKKNKKHGRRRSAPTIGDLVKSGEGGDA